MYIYANRKELKDKVLRGELVERWRNLALFNV